ncbi:putative Zinc metalloproteinase nas-14 [Hypsibius exemplaris]|uniref:Metalloendopeptidase n=1 Tax=Hypsibius exemplaris TaxID=2072580 RepID=A0A1W0X7U0_HYPEX|nr:putative Zinc metalloproteinase nas-14 [Hypsibius exemplaris]
MPVNEDSEYIGDDIPSGWRDYFTLDVVEQLTASSSQSNATFIFQGNIRGINPQSTVAQNMPVNVWPRKTIYYVFGVIDDKTEQFTQAAMRDLEAKTCLRFVPRRTQEDDYLYIAGGMSCESDIGMTGGKQVIILHAGCQDGLGATQHELLHAAGIIHEQARPDRDQFVWINHKNIRSDALDQFAEQAVPVLGTLNLTYDYQSVMHYAWNAFAINPDYPTIIPKEKGVRFGNRNVLSKLDIQRINKLYRCDRRKKPLKLTVDFSETWTAWWKLCDGVDDAPQGWDEDPLVCLKMCERLERNRNGDMLALFNLPGTNRCMMKEFLCDGIQDSEADVSEDKAVCQKFCKGGGYIAIPPSFQCINFQNLCDGKKDTRDGSDEIRANCDAQCSKLAEVPKFEDDFFQLEPLGRCMMKIWLCDNFSTNAFDTMEDPEICQLYCKKGGFFNTEETKQCIHWSKLCDGRMDTTDGWDEVPDNCLSACTSVPGLVTHLINLPSDLPRCMLKTYLCDGLKENDADISEDPEVCIKQCIGNGYFPTPDINQCIRVTSLCDGVVDTRNGWDELPKNCLQYCKTVYLDKEIFVELDEIRAKK